jgi:hypothetical protein
MVIHSLKIKTSTVTVQAPPELFGAFVRYTCQTVTLKMPNDRYSLQPLMVLKLYSPDLNSSLQYITPTN